MITIERSAKQYTRYTDLLNKIYNSGSTTKTERLLIYHNLNFPYIPDTRWILYTC